MYHKGHVTTWTPDNSTKYIETEYVCLAGIQEQ